CPRAQGNDRLASQAERDLLVGRFGRGLTPRFHGNRGADARSSARFDGPSPVMLVAGHNRRIVRLGVASLSITTQPEAATGVAARCIELTKVYGTGDATVTALDHVSADFRTGKFTAIMDPSGSGKST